MRDRVSVVIVVVLMVLVSGCGGAAVEGNVTEQENTTERANGGAADTSSGEGDAQYDSVRRPDIHRHVFREDGVVCYSYRESSDTNGNVVGGTGGLSCLPLNETNVTAAQQPVDEGT